MSAIFSSPFSVAIVAIICWAMIEIVNGPKKKKRSAEDEKIIDDLHQEVNQLRERVVTLEKIVTDEKYSLNKEFENLKRDDVA